MLTITRKADYALVAMADLAEQYPKTVRTRDIAQRLRIPAPVLQKILTRLASCGLVVSIAGPAGGYHLSQPPEEISLAEVIGAIEGSFCFANCTSRLITIGISWSSYRKFEFLFHLATLS